MQRLLKNAVRSLTHTPGFTILALCILSIGIGSTTAMYTVARTVLVKPIAYAHPNQLHTVMLQIPIFAAKYPEIPVNARHARLWQGRLQTVQQFSLMGVTAATLSGRGMAEHIDGLRVSANLFDMLGVQPALGRSFTAEEGQSGKEDVVVISHRFWLRKLAAAPDVLGQKLVLDGHPHVIIGVMPETFPFPRGPQLSALMTLPEFTEYWKPLVFTKDENGGALQEMNFFALVRLQPGATIRQATAEMTSLESELSKELPPGIKIVPFLRSLQDRMAGEVRRPLLVLLASVALVLFVVCLNLMNLLLVRALGRRREWAIRLAMGAALRSLIAETFAESLVLSVSGGALGCLVAVWLLAVVRSNAPDTLPRVSELVLDWHALLMAVAASVFSAVLFGLWPAWRAAHVDPNEALRSSGRSATETRSGHRLGQFLVAGEVALSVVLLLGAGLLLRSFLATLSAGAGVDVRHTFTADIKLPPDRYTDNAAAAAFYKRLLARLSATPGVEVASAVSALPITGESNVNTIRAADRPAPPMIEWPLANYVGITPEYFRAVGIPIKRGRAFTAGDAQADVVILSENLAQRLWPGENPIGHSVRRFADEHEKKLTVVGVVGAVKATSLRDDPALTVYFPDSQWGGRDMSLALRVDGGSTAFANTIRSLVAEIDPQVPVSRIRTMNEVVSESVANTRFQVALLTGFAVSAVLLACLGIYGVLAFTVGRRTPEIGIRMALGAWPDQIRWATLLQGMLPVLLGLVAGLGLSVWMGRALQVLLFGIRALDPLTYAVTAFTLLTAAALACLIPAERAARLNPIDALREE